MIQVAVAPNKFSLGFDGKRAVPSPYQVLELREALGRVYTTDAHLVTYVVEGASVQPRINKAGLSFVSDPVTISVFFCDVDNPGHGTWNDTLLAAALAEYDSLQVLKTAGVYHTAHGRRIVQPLTLPIAAVDAERFLHAWLSELAQAGLGVDWACRDWTRHFRLPHVRRGGALFRAPYMNLDRMCPIEAPEPTPAAMGGTRGEVPTPRSRAPRGGLSADTVRWTDTVPETWQVTVQRLAEAVRKVDTEWHGLFLALAGALLRRGAPAGLVPALCRAVSVATLADTRTDDREAAARSTAQRWLSGEPCTGLRDLARRWPEVAAVLEGFELAPMPAVTASSEDVRAALLETFRNAPDGLTLVAAECGLGKTAAAIQVAAERAAKPYATEGAQGLRAPAQSKTAISVDKNMLAQQIVADLVVRGTPARRLFGPLSVRDAAGEPVCKLHEFARPLIEGGQPMKWEFCRGRDLEHCPFYDDCPARDGDEGDPDARVIIGPHALLAALDGAAGATGLLVIDEPPPLLESSVVTIEDLVATADRLDSFEGRYAGAVRPALHTLLAWVSRLGRVDTVVRLEQALRGAAGEVSTSELEQARRSAGLSDDADLVDCARAAPVEKHRGEAPPLTFVDVRRARSCADHSRSLGRASRVLRLLRHALTAELPHAARIEGRGGERALVLTCCNESLARAVRREGAVVITDANAALHLPILRKTVGYKPPLHTFSAADGAPIERTLLRCGTATRSHWLRKGHAEIGTSLLSAVHAVIAWACEVPTARTLGFITLQPLEAALRAALGETVDKRWGSLKQARERLGPILRRWRGTIAFGHYGATRGLNDMADGDCLATLGDPWPNLGVVHNDIAFLGLEQAWEDRAAALCRAELEQAHGRLRAVNRTRSGRALHVGNLAPSGSGWSEGQVRIRFLEPRPAREASTIHRHELLDIVHGLGGITAVCSRFGCAPRTLSRYLAGDRPAPKEWVDQLINGVLEQPASA